MRRMLPKREGHKRRGELMRGEESREMGPSGQGLGLEGLSRLRSEFDRVLDRFLGAGWAPFAKSSRRIWGSVPFIGGPWTPSVDVIDADREFTIRAELPGIEPKDINLALSGGRLVLSGEKKEEREEKGKAFFRSERRYGAFRRMIPLPSGADPEDIRAEYDKGVLIVHVAKSEVLKSKRIEVSSRGKKE